MARREHWTDPINGTRLPRITYRISNENPPIIVAQCEGIAYVNIAPLRINDRLRSIECLTWSRGRQRSIGSRFAFGGFGGRVWGAPALAGGPRPSAGPTPVLEEHVFGIGVGEWGAAARGGVGWGGGADGGAGGGAPGRRPCRGRGASGGRSRPLTGDTTRATTESPTTPRDNYTLHTTPHRSSVFIFAYLFLQIPYVQMFRFCFQIWARFYCVLVSYIVFWNLLCVAFKLKYKNDNKKWRNNVNYLVFFSNLQRVCGRRTIQSLTVR